MKTLQLLLLFLLGSTCFAQVGIGTTAPNAQLDIRSSNQATPGSNDGLLIPKVDEFPATSPGANQDGMMIYVTGSGTPSKGFYYWDNSGPSWVAIATGSGSEWTDNGTYLSPVDGTSEDVTIGGTDNSSARLTVRSDKPITGLFTNSGSQGTLMYGVNTFITNTTTNTGAFTIGNYNDVLDNGASRTYGDYNNVRGSGSGIRFGQFNTVTGSGTNSYYGNYNLLSGTGSGAIYGSYEGITNSGDGLQYGAYRLLSGNGSGNHYGEFNWLVGSGGGQQYGILNTNNNSGNGDHYGVSNILSGSGSGIHYGASSVLGGTGNGSQYGVYNTINNSGSGDHTGVLSNLSGSGTGAQIGMRSNISNSGDSLHTGIWNSLSGSGLGAHVGVLNSLSGSGPGIQYGVQTNISNSGNAIHYGYHATLNGSGSGTHYGAFNSLAGAGTGLQYASYNSITNTGSGDHTGVLNALGGNGSGAQTGTRNNLTASGSSLNTGTWNAISGGGTGIGVGTSNVIVNSSTGPQYGTSNYINNSGSSTHYGTYNSIASNGSGEQYGVYNNIDNSGSGFHVGVANQITANGSGFHYGFNNNIFGTGGGSHRGINTSISSSGNGDHYGASNTLAGSGSGTHYGTYNWLTAAGTGFQFGVRNLIDNSGNAVHYGTANQLTGNGTGIHYGTHNFIQGTGSGAKYGLYSEISPGSGGTHYGVYSDARKAGSFAGYFLGGVAIGTGTTNTYTLPASRGTNGQVMQTDGSGNVSWNTLPTSTDTSPAWREVSSGNAPTMVTGDISRQGNVGIGSNSASYPLEIVTSAHQRAMSATMTNIVNNSTVYTATLSTTANATNGSAYGISNNVQGLGTQQNVTGIQNLIGNGTDGNLEGTQNTLTTSGDGQLIGTNNNIISTGAGIAYGVRSSLQVGSGVNYGNFTTFVANGSTATSNVFGSFVNIPNNVNAGTHYGFYANVLRSGSFAAYFLGSVSIGTTTSNNYILPASRGTNGQIMQTDGSGNVTWATPANTDLADLDGDTMVQVEEGADDDTIRFDTAGSERMRIENNGIVTVLSGVTDALQLRNDDNFSHGSDNNLDFGDEIDSWMLSSREGAFENSGIYGDRDFVTVWAPADSGRMIRFLDEDSWTDNDGDPYNNSAEIAYVDNLGQFVQVSDRNKKQNIKPITNASQKISQLNGYTYQYKLRPSERSKGSIPVQSSGVIAQELAQVLPEAVQTNDNGEYFVHYAGIIPLLIEGMKEQQELIKEQQQELNRLKKLEDRIKKLEMLVD